MREAIGKRVLELGQAVSLGHSRGGRKEDALFYSRSGQADCYGTEEPAGSLAPEGRAATASASMSGASPDGGPQASATGLGYASAAEGAGDAREGVCCTTLLLLPGTMAAGPQLLSGLASPALLLLNELRCGSSSLLGCLPGVHALAAAVAGVAAAAAWALTAPGRLLCAHSGRGSGLPPSLRFAACIPSRLMRLPEGAKQATRLVAGTAATSSAG